MRRRHRSATFSRLGVAGAALATVLALAAGCAPATPEAGSATSGVPSAPLPSASGPTRPYRPTAAPSPTFAAYVVRTGDTLIGLARRFGTTPESLAYWNRSRYPSLDPDSPAYRPDRIEAGWELAYLPDSVVDPENLPPSTSEPTEAPGPVASAAPYPTLPPDGGAAFVRRGPVGLDAVALTFDYAGGAGAAPEDPEAAIQWLDANGVPATVFLGAGAAAPGDAAAAAVLRRLSGSANVMAGLLAGPSDPAALPAALAAADAALERTLGSSTRPWIRPATGYPDAATLRAAGAAGWTWAVGWDVDPGDGIPPASGGPIATDIVSRVVSRATGGSIVRLHLGGTHTFEALPGIVDGLAAAGLRVVPLAELLGLALPPQ